MGKKTVCSKENKYAKIKLKRHWISLIEQHSLGGKVKYQKLLVFHLRVFLVFVISPDLKIVCQMTAANPKFLLKYISRALPCREKSTPCKLSNLETCRWKECDVLFFHKPSPDHRKQRVDFLLGLLCTMSPLPVDLFK